MPLSDSVLNARDFVHEALNHMTENDIVLMLKDSGSKGYQYNSRRCPVAQYISNRFNVIALCSFAGIRIESVEYTIGDAVDIPPSDNVRQFMRAFDNGSYPSLSLGNGFIR